MKRILTGVIGFPLVVLLLVFSNKYIIDCVAVVIACIAIHEYFHACSKEVKNLSWMGYVLAIGIAFLHIVNTKTAFMILTILMPVLLLISFLHIILTDMKISLKDIVFAFWGIVYVITLISFMPLIYGMGDTSKLGCLKETSFVDSVINFYQKTSVSGKYLIWYMFLTAWGSDTFAYMIGMRFGKHKFSKVSPKKSIEGCIGGIIGAIALSVIYTIVINHCLHLEINLWIIGIAAGIFAVIGQIGDLAASTIKRYFEVKDYSNLFPGHGGMLDRIDSVMFIAPFAFFVFTFIL